MEDARHIPTFFLLGDSTLAAFPPGDEARRFGYGTKLGDCFGNGIQVLDLAIPGRSSKSFRTEEAYARFLREAKPGDFVLVAFGHNDEKPDPLRHTDPSLPVSEPGSFAGSLLEGYLLPARERGVFPLLATPIVRRSPQGVYAGERVHVTEGTPEFPGGDYPACIRRLAQATRTPLLDMTALTLSLYLRLGPERAGSLHAVIPGDPPKIDDSHLNETGAAVLAHLFAAALRRSGVGPAEHLKARLPVPAGFGGE